MSKNNATLALVDRLKTETPEIWNQAQIVGRWVWLEFHVPPLENIRCKLKEFGFHWNGTRKCWQHPCGLSRPRAGGDPRSYYQVRPADEPTIHERHIAKEYKVVALRECP